MLFFSSNHLRSECTLFKSIFDSSSLISLYSGQESDSLSLASETSDTIFSPISSTYGLIISCFDGNTQVSDTSTLALSRYSFCNGLLCIHFTSSAVSHVFSFSIHSNHLYIVLLTAFFVHTARSTALFAHFTTPFIPWSNATLYGSFLLANLDTSVAFSPILAIVPASSANPASFAHLDATFAPFATSAHHHSKSNAISEITPTGSSVIVFAKFSLDPYLSEIAPAT
jgi:hypothetical protein